MTKEHTAHYYFTSFIGSEKYYDFNLNPYDLAILTVICRYLDMPKKFCLARQTYLANEARMSERQFRNSINKLIRLKILTRYSRKKLHGYELGEMLTNVSNIE